MRPVLLHCGAYVFSSGSSAASRSLLAAPRSLAASVPLVGARPLRRLKLLQALVVAAVRLECLKARKLLGAVSR